MATPDSATSAPPDLEDRLRFLFGTVPAADAWHDPAGCLDLLAEDRPDLVETLSEAMLRLGIAGRVLGSDPTGTWQQARQLLAAGTDRHAVMDALVEEIAPLLDDAYDACTDLVRARQVVDGPELDAALRERLALADGDPVAESVVRDALERHLLDPLSEVAGVPSGAIVHLPTLLAGCVLTHHLSTTEEDRLPIDPDLGVFGRLPEPRTAAGPVTIELDDAGDMTWSGPPGWLPRPAAGEVLTVRIDDGVIRPAAATGDLPTRPALVAILREVYDGQGADPPLPLAGDLLVLGALAVDRTAFSVPVAPLVELAAAAGLERRGREFGRGDEAWIAAARIDRAGRLGRRLDDGQVEHAEAALDLIAAGAPADADLRTVLGLIDDGDVLLAVVAELLAPEDPERIAAAVALGDRFVVAAGSSARAVVAHTFASIAVERAGRLDEAESHLRAATAAGQWWLVDERLAWYAADRGRAGEALGHLHDAGLTDDSELVAALAPFAVPVAVPGRNEPCWCGSGRKFKQCHRDQPPLVPLAERVPWLEHKAVLYVGRRGGALDDLVDDLAELLAGDDAAAEAMFDDPLLADVALVEGGWLARFVTERGPLLPPDEAELAASWAAVPRRVYEVVGIGYGTGVTVRELGAGGDGVRVADQAVAAAVTAGELLCARVVDDAAGGLRFAGLVTAVPRGREDELREVLDGGDPFAVLDWLAEAEYLGAP